MARMKQTTVRFSHSVWQVLEREAELNGVSVAEFIRESALARAAYAAGQRDDPFLRQFGIDPVQEDTE